MKDKCFAKDTRVGKNLLESYNFLKIIADKNRLKIICLLKDEPLCVCKVFVALNISQKLTSHHLGQLKRAGILSRKKEGSFVYYGLNEKVLKGKVELLNQLIK